MGSFTRAGPSTGWKSITYKFSTKSLSQCNELRAKWCSVEAVVAAAAAAAVDTKAAQGWGGTAKRHRDTYKWQEIGLHQQSCQE